MKLFIYSQTLTVQPSEFGKGKVISSHTLHGMWLLIHTCIEGHIMASKLFSDDKMVIAWETFPWIILYTRPAIDRGRYIVTSSLIGWFAYTKTPYISVSPRQTMRACFHSNQNGVMLTKFQPLVAPEFIKITTPRAGSDKNFTKIWHLRYNILTPSDVKWLKSGY